MLKLISGLMVAGAASLAISTSASAAPVCEDGSVDAFYVPPWAQDTAATINAYDFCSGEGLVITWVDWWAPYVTYYGPAEVNLNGVYLPTEYTSVTVSDGTGSTTFNVTINRVYAP